jgi:hypothetical protein
MQWPDGKLSRPSGPSPRPENAGLSDHGDIYSRRTGIDRESGEGPGRAVRLGPQVRSTWANLGG